MWQSRSHLTSKRRPLPILPVASNPPWLRSAMGWGGQPSRVGRDASKIRLCRRMQSRMHRPLHPQMHPLHPVHPRRSAVQRLSSINVI